MVKENKSNWPARRSFSIGGAKSGLFLMPILLIMGLFHNPTAASKTEELPKIQTSTIAISTPQVEVQNQDVQVEGETVQKAKTAQFATSSGYGLKIDGINLNIPLSKTGLNKDGTLMVPANPEVAAWYRLGPKPGAAGTALITGHLDSAAGPGVFYNLKKLQVGDVIEVQRDDGKIATFKVDNLASYAQDSTFPWDLVYTTSGASGLRLITCDGVYNPKTQRYSRNLVVYATLVSMKSTID